MFARTTRIAVAGIAAAILALPVAAETMPATPVLATVDGGSAEPLRPHVAALITAAQNKLRASDVLGAITDLDRAMAQRPTPTELGVTLTVRGGALYAQGDLDGALADWNRAIERGALDEATQQHLLHNIEQLERALLRAH